MKPILTISFLYILLFSSSVFGQISIKYDKNYTFKNLALAEASISKKGISIGLSEIKVNNGQEQDNAELPPYYQLFLNVDAIRAIKFPIKPTDSIFFTETLLQQNLKLNIEQEKFIKGLEKKGTQDKADALKEKAKSKKQQIEALKKRLMNGDMSAMTELEKITNELTKEGESITNDLSYEEKEQGSNFELTFIDTKDFLENRLLSGYIYIKEFTEEKFVAEFSGNFITECLPRKTNCESKKSRFVPQTKVFKEGKVSGSINITLIEFRDDR